MDADAVVADNEAYAAVPYTNPVFPAFTVSTAVYAFLADPLAAATAKSALCLAMRAYYDAPYAKTAAASNT